MSKILARGPFVVLKQINLGLCSKYIILEELYKTEIIHSLWPEVSRWDKMFIFNFFFDSFRV